MDKAEQTTDTRTNAQSNGLKPVYWRNYTEGCVLRKGNTFQTDTGATLYWHGRESDEAISYLSRAADMADEARKDYPL